MNIFPIAKRFNDIKDLPSSMMLNKDATLHGKCFRQGTIFSILGWREINSHAYLILSKGSWEGIADYSEFQEKLSSLK